MSETFGQKNINGNCRSRIEYVIWLENDDDDDDDDNGVGGAGGDDGGGTR